MSLLDSISGLRRDYTKGKFDLTNANKNPFFQFEEWFTDALSSSLIEPNAMILSTASKKCKPSSRVVLIKYADERGIVFYTNYGSRKGREIAKNPNASLLFYWDKLERQVRIEGKLEKISKEESENYFNSRPYESKLGAWASKQSQILESRFTLIRRVVKYMKKFKSDITLPPFWGGYRLVPDYFEFWQGRESRLHDRIVYKLEENKWNKSRLYP
jgi:pyridoxamine 5'-phosphate oxidase